MEETDSLSIGDDTTWGRLVSLNPAYPSIELKQNTVVFGRTASACQVVYQSQTISGRHCKIYRDASVAKQNIVFLEDTSTNGTYVNNELIGKGSKILINNGCEIAIIPKRGPERISYIYNDCNEEQKEIEQGGPQLNYHMKEVLGSGNFATVRLAVHKETGNKYALKVIDKKKMSMTSKRKEALMDEVNVLTKVSHENIISINEVFETNKNLYLVLELVTGGELFDRIITEKKFTEDVGRYIMRQICLAVQYLHSRGIAHRDLKPENILCHSPETYVIKISDFGLSRALDEGSFMKTMCGTPQYVAPEILTKGEREGYGKSVDLWSIGVILYILLCGFPPFGDPSDVNFFDRVKRGGFSFPSPYWDEISEDAKDLIKKLIIVDVEKRLTIDQTLSHPWFTNHVDDIKKINNIKDDEKVEETKQEEEKKVVEEEKKQEEEKKEDSSSIDPRLQIFEIPKNLVPQVLIPTPKEDPLLVDESLKSKNKRAHSNTPIGDQDEIIKEQKL
ncbi:protein kinase 1 [Cavenderia fasciculata]|uniref:non-specific serine/threonine protein kinase n=1 Tax=Cavenderia fasciculata TaxID=261658 RepID=F4Q918_CACFS|nr:protein kinase 1 [Cavenderia fasciculata]EGG15187.1 protein kinase 1 [Cavenderia fasciculata]|eukprot:XP_004351907.1 protein kinase 1 [Cavenderia fasciculata]